jgi:hypothetical protein
MTSWESFFTTEDTEATEAGTEGFPDPTSAPLLSLSVSVFSVLSVVDSG